MLPYISRKADFLYSGARGSANKVVLEIKTVAVPLQGVTEEQLVQKLSHTLESQPSP